MALVLLLLLLCFLLTPPTTLSLNQEGLYLYKFKLSVDDPHSILSSWNPLHNTPCNWTGIKCHPQKFSVLSLNLSNANISGPFPASILCRLTNLTSITLSKNSIYGTLPSEISLCHNLLHLDISQNLLTGPLPLTLSQILNLVNFHGSNNKFSGSLPNSILNLGQLACLDLHSNNLSGELPRGIQSWEKLILLNLSHNELSGQIPDEIKSLSMLNVLDLSYNQFSGKIPMGLQNLKLIVLNLSYNQLSGQLPPLLAKDSYSTSFLGNLDLCGDLKYLCDGRDKTSFKHAWFIGAICAFVIFSIVLIAVMLFRKVENESKWILTSFHKLGFSVNEILDCLEDNVIGSGSSGKVYKVVLSNGEVAAVKKLWSGIKKEIDTGVIEKGQGQVQDCVFDAEVETLSKIRHKNIVKLWCCCTKRDCKLLVYEYMANGSLGDLLHRSKGGLLDWPTRYKIALDAAEGLSYLHHDCVPPIIHRDVKSNNILLDGDFGARVADFGVAKVVQASGKGTKSMSVIAGSYGYIAPEYAYTLRVNEKSDIYSFGVVILELVTGKRPVEAELGEKDLTNWVCTTLDQQGVDYILDPKLDSCFKEQICKLLNIGLLCTNPLPINRPSMKTVVKMLQEVGEFARV